MASDDRQRGGSRDEQKRGDEGTGEHGDGLAERSGSHFKTPLHYLVEPVLGVRALINARSVPIRKNRCFSMELMRSRCKLPVFLTENWENRPISSTSCRRRR